MNVKDYILADRQWKRDHRVAHARSQLAKATTPLEKSFWEAVLTANLE